MADAGRGKRKAAGSSMTPDKKKHKREYHFISSWTETFDGIGKSHRGSRFARCTYCGIDIKVTHGGKNDVQKHLSTSGHREAERACKTTPSVRSLFLTESGSHEVIEAETRWAMFLAKHNVPFLASDHASDLFKSMFPDSKIAKNFACARTKATSIVKEALAPHCIEKVARALSLQPFGLLMDESNDKVDKSCIILVRMLDQEAGDVRTRFLDMPVVNIGTASNLFAAVQKSLNDKGLDFSHAIAFMSDTTNVMKGMRSGVQKLIKNENPSTYDVGCICHLADLAIKAGMKGLPVDIDQLFIDIFYYFYHSSKRTQEFEDNWRDMFTTEPSVILKHCPTRWLSLLRCVERYLVQLDGLISYFASCDEGNAKIRSILQRLRNPLLKPLLQFLQFVLQPMNRFNRLFQKSTENTTSELYTEMTRLTRLYASNFVKAEVIQKVGDNLNALSFSEENLLDNERIGIGTHTWETLTIMQEELSLTPFFSAAKQFYRRSTEKMLKKFPFGDTLLRDMVILNPNQVMACNVDTLVSLAKRFPQLNIDAPNEIQLLKEEFADFCLSPNDHPEIEMYDHEGIQLPRSGSFWFSVSKIKTAFGEARFPTLTKLMLGLLCIPASNADAERGFSMLRKIHTDSQPRLAQSTIVSLMAVKMNIDKCCLDVELSSELLKSCKQATRRTMNNSH